MPENLENIQPPEGGKDVLKTPDPQTQQEHRAYRTEWEEACLDDFRQDIKERKKYANRIYGLVVVWLIGVAYLLIRFDSRVDSAVLIALLSGTTVNVLGVFVVVAKYLFPQHKNHIEYLHGLQKEETAPEPTRRTRKAPQRSKSAREVDRRADDKKRARRSAS